MNKIFKHGSGLAIALYILTSCYPKGPEYYSDLDLTVTDYDMEYDFGAQKKYFMADTIEYKTNIKDSELDPADVYALLKQIEANFDSLGYESLDDANAADAEFVISVSAIASETSGGGWIGGPPCYPGWGWGCGWNPWYPPYWGGGYYSYSYTTGSVVINWFDPQTPPASFEGGEAQPVHWLAIFNGLMSSSRESNFSRIQESVDQAFKQSPYIQSNN